MKHNSLGTATLKILALMTLLAALALPVVAQRAPRVADAIWAHGLLYDTVITPTSFVSPPEQSTDVIYSFMMSGLEGQRSVAESAPGDPDFNGGRWTVKAVVFTPEGLDALDPDGDGFVNFELTTAEDVLQQESLGYLVIYDTAIYFECPMLPNRGRH